MDDLTHAANLIGSALDALAIAAIRNPDLRADFAKRCDRLRQLRNEVEAMRSQAGDVHS
jgi:siroheme synthase (precorrin-2 oxidase/ferrochelatase)